MVLAVGVRDDLDDQRWALVAFHSTYEAAIGAARDRAREAPAARFGVFVLVSEVAARIEVDVTVVADAGARRTNPGE